MDPPADSGTSNTIPSDVQPNAEQGREYGCKYCTKAFSNKQALGGHQNAHKIQRALEKAAFESEGDNRFRRDDGLMTYPGPNLGPSNVSRDLFNTSVVNNFPYCAPQQQQQQQQQQQGMRIGCNVCPRQLLPWNACGIARPVPGYNIFSQGWTASRPRGIIPQFPGHGGHYVQNKGLNFRFPERGAASSSGTAMGYRPVHPDMSGLAAARVRPGGDNRNGSNEDESELDLSLKL